MCAGSLLFIFISIYKIINFIHFFVDKFHTINLITSASHCFVITNALQRASLDDAQFILGLKKQLFAVKLSN